MWGLLIGDACGVPYEFRRPEELPPIERLDMFPPKNFLRSYAHVPLGTWSDDGAQALCLYSSLTSCGHYHPHDFASRLLRWHDHGYMAVDNYVFDIGNQTSVSINRLKSGATTNDSGMRGERNNGNGSLMRCLPLALLHRGSDDSLVADAHRQSRLTHGHARAQVCCALYCLWARRELQGICDAWEDAVESLKKIYRFDPKNSMELHEHVLKREEKRPQGTGYVVDSLHSAKLACQESNFERTIKKAISLGNDTDTTASIAGGIAGIRFGASNFPTFWKEALRGKEILAWLDLQIP